MNIGIDLRTLMNGNKSGIPGFTLSLMQNILKEDTQNDYFGFYNSYNTTPLPEIGNNIEIKKYSLPNKVLNSSIRFLGYPKIDKIVPSDIFYMPHFAYNSLSSKSYKIITVHDLSFLRYPEFFSFKNNIWHKLVEIKKTLKTFDKIIAISENTKNDLIELLDISEEKIEVIYSGISDRYKKIDTESVEVRKVKEKYMLPEKFILSLGTIEPRKNIDTLIRAFDDFSEKSLDNYYLVISGGMGWKYKKVLNEYNRAKNKDKIIFTGFVDEEDKNIIYNLSKLFVFPSYYEGFGFPPLEAMKAGTAVIASANSSMFEILDRAAYFIDPYDVNDLSKAMIELLSNYDLKKELEKKGVENSQKFSWQKTSNAYISLFNNSKKKKIL